MDKEQPQTEPARIVLIEDNPGDVFLLREALDFHGDPYVMEVLSDGEEALSFIRFHAHAIEHPCFFILDLYLPRYDGLEVVNAIREAPALAGMHIAVLTGGAISVEQRAALLAANVSVVMMKSTNWSDYVKLAAQIFLICGPTRFSRGAG